MEVRSTVLSYSAKKKKNTNNNESLLEKEIEEIEAKVNVSPQDLELIAEKKTDSVEY